MTRIGFFLTPTKGWMGGINYFRNLFSAIAAAGVTGVEIFLIVPADVDDEVLKMMLPDPPTVIVIRTKLLQKGHPLWWLWRGFRKLFNSELVAWPLVRRHRFDVVSHSDFVRGTGAVVINWLPDFQHIHLPEMFDSKERENRGFKYINLSNASSKIVVSSEDSRRDLLLTQSTVDKKAEVLSFISPAPEKYWLLNENDRNELSKKYKLESEYFYVPNQFWRHKNHIILLKALKIAIHDNVKFQIVCSGATTDHRNPKYYSEILEYQRNAGLETSFKILGIIPYEDVFKLIRFSCAVVNPSNFEGWSSTVEECKSVGKRMLLSSLSVHREQLPEAQFFAPNSPLELSKLFKAALNSKQLESTHQHATPEINRLRLSDYGHRYLEIVDKAISERLSDEKR